MKPSGKNRVQGREKKRQESRQRFGQDSHCNAAIKNRRAPWFFAAEVSEHGEQDSKCKRRIHSQRRCVPDKRIAGCECESREPGGIFPEQMRSQDPRQDNTAHTEKS